jgi:hypothetical protein
MVKKFVSYTKLLIFKYYLEKKNLCMLMRVYYIVFRFLNMSIFSFMNTREFYTKIYFSSYDIIKPVYAQTSMRVNNLWWAQTHYIQRNSWTKTNFQFTNSFFLINELEWRQRRTLHCLLFIIQFFWKPWSHIFNFDI